jgi:hypothetical protein
MTRHAHSIAEIKDMLLAQVDAVAHHYAPEASGSYHDKGLYFTLNPGRADRSVGSFVVRLAGPKAGTWNDYATGDHGDLIDLIRLSLGCTLGEALREARAFLGLNVADPALVRQREKGAAEARARREEAERRRKDMKRRAADQALALWLSAQERIKGTPVERYLADARCIDLAQLGRQPRAIRYLPECYYRHVDPRTGEIIEARLPAMVTIVSDRTGRGIALHRTYLQLKRGAWSKADLPVSKKVLGDYAGAAIHLWRGLGPRGGKPPSLWQAPPGTRVFIAEGIEDGLSAAMLLPEARILAALSLANLGRVELPPTVDRVTLIADQDEHAEARAQLDRAVALHQKAGRRVSVWRNTRGGKDLNDALREELRGDGKKGAADAE